MTKIPINIAYRQIGWMKCVACSDFKQRPGVMWLGVSRIGVDETITCPVCKGTSQVPRYQVIDVATGKEIDYDEVSEQILKMEAEKKERLFTPQENGNEQRV